MKDETEAIKLNVKLEKFDSNLWHYHFKLGDEIAAKLIQPNNKRILCQFEDLDTVHTAIMKMEGHYFVNVNQEIRNQLKLQIGDYFTVRLSKDYSEFGMEVPEELIAMLEQEDSAKNVFEQLTIGKQRNLIYIVSKVKNTDSRIKKALAIVHHLKECQGILDFKRLNELIKHYNNQF